MRELIWLACFWILHFSSLSAQDTMRLDQGLAGYWNFDQYLEGGIIQDLSGYESHGTVSGTSLAQGIMGHALHFDGTDDMVTITGPGGAVPGLIKSLGEGSISVWFRLDKLPEGEEIQPIFYFGALEPCVNMADAANQGVIIEVGHHPVHMNSRRIYFTIFANGCRQPSFCFDSGEDLEAGKWYHFVAVVGKRYNAGYLDGEPMEFIKYNFGDSSDSQFFEDARQKEVIWLGKGYWDAESCHLDGLIDELRIYIRPLTDKEVKELYLLTGGSAGSPAALSADGFSVFPNPAGSRLHVEWPQSQEGKPSRFLITDAAGRLVRVEEPSPSIGLEGLPGGSYRLFIETGCGSQVFPFIKAE